MWYALLIPLLISAVGYLFYSHKITLWELFIPTAACALCIVISYFSLKSVTLSDMEYNGHLVQGAIYYEPYTTWVSKTCSYTTCSGSGKNQVCTTHYYDCSYCDENPAEYYKYDSGGNNIAISREKFILLKKKWRAESRFQELNRTIREHGSCGVDGDAYTIDWDKHIKNSETSTFEKDFENILKCNHSAFNYPVVTVEQARKKGLYDYPTITSEQRQISVLGLDSVKIKNRDEFQTKLSYLNGKLGATKKVRIYTLIFSEKEIDAAFLQEAYWDGGNQNELVVCIGTDSEGNMKWVKPFSWCDNKRVCVDTREDLMEIGKLDADKMLKVYEKNINAFWKYKSFKDFNYLSFEPTTGQLIFVHVLTTIISILSLIWCIRNDTDSKENGSAWEL